MTHPAVNLFSQLQLVGSLAKETGLAAETILSMDAGLVRDLIDVNTVWQQEQIDGSDADAQL